MVTIWPALIVHWVEVQARDGSVDEIDSDGLANAEPLTDTVTRAA
jgi:hypothetical protein